MSFYGLSAQTACDDDSRHVFLSWGRRRLNASGLAAKCLRPRIRKHSVAAAAVIRDEEELYSDMKSGNDDRVDSVSPARGSWRSARRPHGGRLERFPANRVQICDTSPQWSSTGGSSRPDGFDSWAWQIGAQIVRAVSVGSCNVGVTQPAREAPSGAVHLAFLSVKLFSKISIASHIIHLSNYRSYLRTVLPSCLSVQEKMRLHHTLSKKCCATTFKIFQGIWKCAWYATASRDTLQAQWAIYLATSQPQNLDLQQYFKSATKLCYS